MSGTFSLRLGENVCLTFNVHCFALSYLREAGMLSLHVGWIILECAVAD
jgi:hypothetical protein